MSRRSESIANKVYRYVHHKDEWIDTNLSERAFKNEWLEIEDNGRIIIKGSNKNGYAWDGCSPTWYFLQLIWGTPDGRLDYNTEKPITYYASMVHDILYQFKKDINISRKEADILFMKLLKKAKFMWWWLYYIGVRIGGLFYGRWKTRKSAKKLDINDVSWI